MPYRSLYEYFPQIAEKETRNIQIVIDPSLSDDLFSLIELYCDEPGCDCRRVMLNVISEKRKETVVVVNFGWENEKFYSDWFGHYDKNVIAELKGPSINTFAATSDISEKIFEHILVVLKDTSYVKRIIEHYNIFRKYVESQPPVANLTPVSKSIGRNELCPCGSGQKYKNCCAEKN